MFPLKELKVWQKEKSRKEDEQRKEKEWIQLPKPNGLFYKFDVVLWSFLACWCTQLGPNWSSDPKEIHI